MAGKHGNTWVYGRKCETFAQAYMEIGGPRGFCSDTRFENSTAHHELYVQTNKPSATMRAE